MSRVPLRNSVRSVLVVIPRHSTYIELLGVVSRENPEYVDQRGCRTGGSGFSQGPPRTLEPNVQDLVCRADAGVAAAGYWGSHKISKAMIEMLRTDAELEGYSPAPESMHWTCGVTRDVLLNVGKQSGQDDALDK